MDEFIEELKKLCEKYDAAISTCRCCGLTIWVGDKEVRGNRDTVIDKNGLGVDAL